MHAYACACACVYMLHLHRYEWDPYGCHHIVGVRPCPVLVQSGLTGIALGNHMASKSISVSVRAGWLRVSIWLYNTERDIHLLVKALQSAVQLVPTMQSTPTDSSKHA